MAKGFLTINHFRAPSLPPSQSKAFYIVVQVVPFHDPITWVHLYTDLRAASNTDMSLLYHQEKILKLVVVITLIV